MFTFVKISASKIQFLMETGAEFSYCTTNYLFEPDVIVFLNKTPFKRVSWVFSLLT